MAQIEYIKHLYEVEGKSLRTIAKTMNLNFRTVKKYAVQSDWSSSTNTNRKSNYPVLGEYLDIIDSWLEDDTKQPRKQRHTGKRVYDRLKEEYGFNGGLRTVTEYVSRKKKLLAESIEGYLPLEHLPAESQLDFGEFKYIDGHGEDKKAYYLTLSFPYSNAAFTQVFKGQNQECLMEGMKIIFSHINGVPPSIMMDNMKTVVTKVLKFGEREISEGFRRFALHYRFKPIFCNPSSGNEKGNVENKVGYHRRNWFVPVPVIEDFEEFNESLWLKAHNDMNRTHYKKEIPISSLWQQEQAKLLYLPENEYEVFKLEQVRVDNYGFIDVDGNSYCASPELCSNIVTAKIYFNKVAIYHEHSLIKEYRRSYGKKDEIYDWKQYITLLCKKPGALEHTKFYSQIPKLWREHIEKLERSERKTALMLLREIVAEDALDIGNEALAIANLYGKSDTESIRQCYYSLTHETRSLEPCKFDISPPIISYEPKLSEYDKLTDMGVM